MTKIPLMSSGSGTLTDIMTGPPARVVYTYNLAEKLLEPNTTPSNTGLDVNLYYNELYNSGRRSNRGFPSHPSEDEEYERLDEEDRKKMIRALPDVD
jgi:hypothetical protein